ncbi:cupin domain-containing protein [Streptomyces sp. NPDC005921]|uniref:cupin domain-containing protein n=1 Tax=Streptomyces sp. NPDC005827 TaxID=3157070 RepID=UPI003406E4BF
MNADAVRRALNLEPLPVEGGLYTVSYRDEHSNGIYYLLESPDFSAMHVLDSAEVYHYYSGAPLSLLLLLPDGSIEQPVLGPDVLAGQVPQLLVPAGVWQGSSSTGDWTLVGTTMAPPYRDEGVRFAHREELSARYPDAAARIGALTRQ